MGGKACHQHTCVLHGESITDQASPRTPTQRTFQPQEAVQPQQNQTILQADTPAQKAHMCVLLLVVTVILSCHAMDFDNSYSDRGR